MLYIVGFVSEYGPQILNTLNGLVSTQPLEKVLQMKKAEFENAIIEGTQLKATRGDWSRYSVEGAKVSSVVLFKLVDDMGNLMGYTIYDFNKQVRDYNPAEAISIGLKYGYANAKVSTNKNGSFLCALGGKFVERTVRTDQTPLSKLTVEIVRQKEKTHGFVILTTVEGEVAQYKISVSNENENPVGHILGKTFNRFLKFRLYEVLDGKKPSVGEKPMGITIAKTADFKEGLPYEEYGKVARYLGINAEEVFRKEKSSMFLFKL